MPAVPLSRASAITFHAPAASSDSICSTHTYGAMMNAASLLPTSDRTVKPSPASRSISASLRSCGSSIVPSEISTCVSSSSRSQATSCSTLLLRDRQLGERAAEHDGDPVGAVAGELGVEVLGDDRRPPAELDEVDRGAGDLDQALDLGDRQAAVEHVRDPPLARLRAALREVEEGGRHGVGAGGGTVRRYCRSAPTVTTTVAVQAGALRAGRLGVRVDRLDRVGRDVQRLRHLLRLGLVTAEVGDDRHRAPLVGGVRDRALHEAVGRRASTRRCSRAPASVVPLSTATVTLSCAGAAAAGVVCLGAAVVCWTGVVLEAAGVEGESLPPPDSTSTAIAATATRPSPPSSSARPAAVRRRLDVAVRRAGVALGALRARSGAAAAGRAPAGRAGPRGGTRLPAPGRAPGRGAAAPHRRDGREGVAVAVRRGRRRWREPERQDGSRRGRLGRPCAAAVAGAGGAGRARRDAAAAAGGRHRRRWLGGRRQPGA